MVQVTIIGTGLIGGSIGLALKQAKIQNMTVVACDKDPSIANRAVKRAAADRRELNLIAAVQNADLVIIATPAGAIREVLESVGPHLKSGATVTDTGSSKARVLQWAQQYLPSEVSFVGGHPMAGKEDSGIDAADPDLFRDATYCILPAPKASQAAVETVVNLAKLLGARPYFIGPEEHDTYVAAVSHLPLMLSAVLVSCAAKSPGWREMGRLAAGGFRDTSRLASGDPVMSRDICLTNPQLIIHWIDVFSQELGELRRLINEESADLEKAFIQARDYRERWRADRLEEVAETVELPSSSERTAALFMGDTMAEKMLRPDSQGRESRHNNPDKRRP